MTCVKSFFVTGTALLLAGCIGPVGQTLSDFAPADAEGEIDKTMRSYSQRAITSVGDGFAWKVGTYGNGNLMGVAGLTAGTDVAPPPPSGTANYTGQFNIGLVEDIHVTSTAIYGYTGDDTGAFSVTADFDSNRITGSGAGRDGILRIDGEISGDRFAGSSSYRGVSGKSKGLAGSDMAIGVVHGNSDDLIYAGGFRANRRY